MLLSVGTRAPGTGNLITKTTDDDHDKADDEGGLSGWAIFGITVGVYAACVMITSIFLKIFQPNYFKTGYLSCC